MNHLSKLLFFVLFLTLPSLSMASDMGGGIGFIFLFIILIPITALIVGFLFKLIESLSGLLSRRLLILIDLIILIFFSIIISYFVEPPPYGYGEELLILILFTSILSLGMISVASIVRNGFNVFKRVFLYVAIVAVFAPLLAFLFVVVEDYTLYVSDCEVNLTMHYDSYVRWAAKDHCLSQKALKEQNVIFCEKRYKHKGGQSFSNDFDRKFCYNRIIVEKFARGDIDVSLCPKSLYPDDCYLEAAELKKDKSICNFIVDSNKKDSCHLQTY